MKVFYKLPVLGQIQEAIEKAKMSGNEIEYILLTEKELRSLRKQVGVPDGCDDFVFGEVLGVNFRVEEGASSVGEKRKSDFFADIRKNFVDEKANGLKK